MKSKKLQYIGGAILLIILFFNLQYAFSNYSAGLFATSSSSSTSSELLGSELGTVCPPEYDIYRTTTSGFIYSTNASLGGSLSTNLKYLGSIGLNASGQMEYQYAQITTQRIQTSHVECPTWSGFCFRKACGQMP